MEAAPSPRYLADEMLGRLARYLRFFGFDTEYVRGMKDEAIARRATAERRVLLTRDRDLARRTPGAILLHATEIGSQLREVVRTNPTLELTLRFDRCAECNAPLLEWTPPEDGAWPEGLPMERVLGGLAVYECRRCSRRFWEGSHARSIRARTGEWLERRDDP